MTLIPKVYVKLTLNELSLVISVVFDATEVTKINKMPFTVCLITFLRVDTVQSAIQLLGKELLPISEPLCLSVRRDFLMIDAMREAKKKKFNPKKRIKVKLAGYMVSYYASCFNFRLHLLKKVLWTMVDLVVNFLGFWLSELLNNTSKGWMVLNFSATMLQLYK